MSDAGGEAGTLICVSVGGEVTSRVWYNDDDGKPWGVYQPVGGGHTGYSDSHATRGILLDDKHPVTPRSGWSLPLSLIAASTGACVY
jgi:hypothetical protein